MDRFYLFLGRNPIQVAILLVLVVGGIVVLLFQNMKAEEPPKPVKREWKKDDWLRSRYSGADCVNDPHCRQLKRIFEEGGQTTQAVVTHMMSADKSLRFESVRDDAARYEGKAWVFTGKIYEILANSSTGTGDQLIASINVDGDPAKTVSVRGDFATKFAVNDEVVVVGYLTGASYPRLGPASLKYSGKIPSMSLRALLKPNVAVQLQTEQF
jgi:hypothetical protein